MSGSISKICVVCGQDCSQRPRIKNAQGQYACRACAEAKQAEQAQTTPVAAGLDDGFDGLSAEMLDDLPIDSMPASGPPVGGCPGCGSPLGEDALICVSCGYNMKTGSSVTTRSIAQKEPSAVGAAVATGGMLASPILWTIGGVIGGTIGAAVWAGIVYFLNYEIAYVAILVGALTGLGVSLAARRYAGVASGAVAVIIAIVAMLGGKYAAIALAVDDELGEFSERTFVPADFAVDEEDMLLQLTDEIAFSREEAGEKLDWPDGMIYDDAFEIEDYPGDVQVAARSKWDTLNDQQKSARLAIGAFDDRGFVSQIAKDIASALEASNQSISWPDDIDLDTAWAEASFPPEIWRDAQTRWNALGEAGQSAERDRIQQEWAASINAMQDEFRDIITEAGFMASFTIFDVLWFGLAVVFAYKVGETDLTEFG